jgi:hypothetical protein
MKPLTADDLAQYTDEDFATLEQGVAKERKRRNKTARAKAKMHQLADTFGYTLEQKEGEKEKTPQSVATIAKTSTERKLGSSTG